MYCKDLLRPFIYPQKIETLCDDHPDVYANFITVFHVVRRSDRYCAGLSTDLIIEQVLMRSIKTSGGLTHGKGLTDILAYVHASLRRDKQCKFSL